ncbi:MAG: M56 family metallopeptidase [Pseudomonadota bacterium]
MSSEIFGDGILAIWTLDTMVSMTLLMALVLLLRRPVGHFFGPHIAYLLWILPLARLFMPTLTVTAPPPTPAEPVASAVIGSELVQSSAAQQVAVSAFASVDWLMVAVIIWLGGAGLLFLSKLAGYFQFREDILADGELVGRHGNIRILETAAVNGPLAFGLFDKYIAVPANFFRNYAPKERELALDHEIAHHESGDLAANFIGLLILSLHWFNPVAWFAWIAFRQDQETACDARILKQSGRSLRAVYGRTIAKSASGHKLGLASPLNQKNKIKDRLKMLGQSEKSGFRKKLGMLMVGASTFAALPLTATVVYAEADIEEADFVEAVIADDAHADDAHANDAQAGEDHGDVQVRTAGTTVDVGDKGVLVTEKTTDGYKYTISNKRGTFEFESNRKLKRSQIDEKLTRMVPSYKKSSLSVPPAPPVPAVPPVPAPFVDKDEVVNITMLNGSTDFARDKQFVYKIKHDGRTIVLRTNQKLSKEKAREMVVEAEQSRREADAELHEHKKEMKERNREMREHQQMVRIELRQAERERQQALREAAREMREAQREARTAAREAEREAREALREALEEARERDSEASQTSRKTARQTSRVWSIANQVVEISYAPRLPVKPKSVKVDIDCQAMNKKIAFAGKRGDIESQAWAVVAGCGTLKTKVDEKKMIKLTLQTLKQRRDAAAKSCNNPDADLRRKIRNYDREIKELEAGLKTI